MNAEKIFRTNFKKLFIIVWIFFGIVTIIWIIDFTQYFKFYSYDDIDYTVTKNNTTSNDVACRVPKLDPWDLAISHLIKHPKNFTCTAVQPFLTHVDYEGILRINETERSSFNFEYRCYYRMFDKTIGLDDNNVEYDRHEILTNDITLTKDCVEVDCRFKNETTFYFNIHSHPVKRVDRIFAEQTESQLSLLLFMIDSTSFSVLQRNLPLTYDYTRNVMGMKYLRGYNKVGENSFPNMMAMLLGKRVMNEQDDMLRELDSDSGTYFDAWPIIWKMFAAKGYATIFNEDMPRYGLFHYMLKGFVKKPADFYYHPFWMAIGSRWKVENEYFCFYNTPKARIHFDLTKRHMITMKDNLKFVYSVLSEHAHNYENDIERVDDELVNFWKQLYDGGYLNKTAVIFCSDHGIRFGRIRSSFTGLLEERLPFYGIWFPEWFYRKYPHLEHNINGNTDILSSTFDVHETMQDILNENYNGNQRNLMSRGLSQLYPIPKNRTCNSAGIPNHYCTCLKEVILPENHSIAIAAAMYLVKHLNFILTNHSDICQIITFSKILYAKQVDYDQKLKANVHSYAVSKLFDNKTKISRSRLMPGLTKETVEIAIEANPFNARFEAMLKSDFDNFGIKIWMVLGAISRISSYDGLSDCVEDKILRKYCPCKVTNKNQTVS